MLEVARERREVREEALESVNDEISGDVEIRTSDLGAVDEDRGGG